MRPSPELHARSGRTLGSGFCTGSFSATSCQSMAEITWRIPSNRPHRNHQLGEATIPLSLSLPHLHSNYNTGCERYRQRFEA